MPTFTPIPDFVRARPGPINTALGQLEARIDEIEGADIQAWVTGGRKYAAAYPSLQVAIDACAAGETLVIAPGTYPVASTLSVNKALTIEADGVILEKTADIETMKIEANPASDRAVSSVQKDTVVLSGADGWATYVHSATVASTSGLALWDWVLVYSTTDTFANSGESRWRWGERAQIVEIAGNTVKLNRWFTCMPAGVSNVRLAKYTPMAVKIRGLGFTVNQATANANTWVGGALVAVGLIAPVFDGVRVYANRGDGLDLRGCIFPKLHGCTIDNVDIEQAAGDPASYGVKVRGCHQLQATLCSFNRTRHGITTSGRYAEDVTNVLEHGQAIGAAISGCVSHMSDAGGFDTHGDAFGWVYTACSAVGAIAGESGGGPGFNIRGRDIVLSSCSALNTQYGIRIFNQWSTAETANVRVEGFTYTGREEGFIVAGKSGAAIPNVGIAGTFRTLGFSRMAGVEHAEVRAHDALLELGATPQLLRAVEVGDGGVLRAYDVTVDLSESTDVSGLPVVVDLTAADSVVEFRGRIVGADKVRAFGNSATAGARGWAEIAADAPFTDVEQYLWKFASPGDDSEQFGGVVRYDHGVDPGEYAAIRRFELTTDVSETLYIRNRGDDCAWIVTATHADSALNGISEGSRDGQTVQIRCAADSANSLTLKDIGTRWDLSADGDVTLAPGATAAFAWDHANTVWERIA
jgi:hypothetical protein